MKFDKRMEELRNKINYINVILKHNLFFKKLNLHLFLNKAVIL